MVNSYSINLFLLFQTKFIFGDFMKDSTNFFMIRIVSLQKNADMIFGAVTIICGIVGTLSGGFILDRVDATIPNAFKVKKGFSYCFRITRVFIKSFLFLDAALIRSNISRGDILLHCFYLKEFIRFHRPLCLGRASCVCYTGRAV